MEFVVPRGFGEVLENRLKANKGYFLLSQFCTNEEIENCKGMSAADSEYVFDPRFIYKKLVSGPRHYKFAMEFIKGYVPRIRPENISQNYIINTNDNFVKDKNTRVVAIICLQHSVFSLYVDNNTTNQKVISIIPGDLFLFDSTLHISGKISGLILFILDTTFVIEEPAPPAKWSSYITPLHGWLF